LASNYRGKSDVQKNVHGKKRFAIFPSPAWMLITKLSLARESLVCDIPAGEGKIAHLFYSVVEKRLVKMTTSHLNNIIQSARDGSLQLGTRLVQSSEASLHDIEKMKLTTMPILTVG
jgi:hypothetical protein